MNYLRKFWKFLKEDTWQSWLVSLVLAFIIIKFVFFPVMTLVTGSALPLVVVESCSMYHEVGFDDWWDRNLGWYEHRGITRDRFDDFPFKNGLNKGDIVLVYNRGEVDLGDVIIFNSVFRYPLIHRVVTENPLGTKGDHNFDQIGPPEEDIPEDQIIGKAVARVPGLGWFKLIFFEGLKPEGERGFCK